VDRPCANPRRKHVYRHPYFGRLPQSPTSPAIEALMDKWKVKTRSARNKLAEATSSGTGTAALHVPHSSLAPHDNASTFGVSEGFLGQSAARDFAAPENQAVRQPALEPPTSLSASVDAGKPVLEPSRHGSPPPRFTPRQVHTAVRKGKERLLTMLQHTRYHFGEGARQPGPAEKSTSVSTAAGGSTTSQYWHTTFALIQCHSTSRSATQCVDTASECTLASFGRESRTGPNWHAVVRLE
jgi:hypothetical protein